MEISDAEFGALDVDGKVDLTSSREILDVAVAAVLWSPRDGSSALFSDFLFDRIFCAACVDIDGLRWLGNHSVHGIG